MKEVLYVGCLTRHGIRHYINKTKNPHITKLSARIAYLTSLSPEQKKA
jgi:hypothetical protein